MNRNNTLCFLTFYGKTEYSLLIKSKKNKVIEALETAKLYAIPTIDNVTKILDRKNIKYEFIKGKRYLIDCKYLGASIIEMNMIND